MAYTPATKRAIAKYSVDTCKAAYRYSQQGYGARSIWQECVSGLTSTRSADAAINAGREIASTPAEPKLTFKAATAEALEHGAVIQRRVDEYRVRLSEWEWSHAGVYFTSDLQDALDTAKAMRAHVNTASAVSARPQVAQGNYRLQLMRPNLRTELESFADLYGNLYAGFANGSIQHDEFPDSRSHIDTVLVWAAEFEERHAGREWDGEYIEAIDDFFTEKLRAWRGDAVCTGCTVPGCECGLIPAEPAPSPSVADEQAHAARMACPEDVLQRVMAYLAARMDEETRVSPYSRVTGLQDAHSICEESQALLSVPAPIAPKTRCCNDLAAFGWCKHTHPETVAPTESDFAQPLAGVMSAGIAPAGWTAPDTYTIEAMGPRGYHAWKMGQALDQHRPLSVGVDGDARYTFNASKVPVRLYRIEFVARTVGALGVCSTFVREVSGVDGEAAVLALYSDFEHITPFSVREVPASAPDPLYAHLQAVARAASSGIAYSSMNDCKVHASAWSTARADYDAAHGVNAFDALSSIDFGSARPSRNQAVREYLSRS